MPSKTQKAFGLGRLSNCHGSVSGTGCWIGIVRLFSGSSEARPIWHITRSTIRSNAAGEDTRPWFTSTSESAVIGRPDELRGEVISAFVVLRQGFVPSDQVKKELLDRVGHELGPVAVIGELNFVDMVPKTRSGKIMRRVLKAVIQERNPGDITTIEDEGSVEEARQAWHQMREELKNALQEQLKKTG